MPTKSFWRRVDKRARKAAKLRGRIAPHGIDIEREPDGVYTAWLDNYAVQGPTRHAAIENLRRVLRRGNAIDVWVAEAIQGIWPAGTP